MAIDVIDDGSFIEAVVAADRADKRCISGVDHLEGSDADENKIAMWWAACWRR